jgi:regulation of enolase protein 1 (concanavalin A-like superfamily)
MFRETLDADAKHVLGAVYAAGGVALQSRSATGGSSSEAARRAGTVPEWVRLRRAGDTFTLSASNDGVTWTTVGSSTVPMAQVVYVGLPVTSRVAGTLATAIFDDVVIEP